MFSIVDYKKHFTDPPFVYCALRGIVLFCLSLIFISYSIQFADTHASNSVTDIILSNTPVFNVNSAYVYGGLLLIVGAALTVLAKPRYIPFATSTIALFYLTRGVFISLTHLGPFPTQLVIAHNFVTDSYLLSGFFTGEDFFFSGHTGLPFLMALIFWDFPVVRYIYIGLSVFFGAVVLLGHLHYSIDVLSAFFITYTIYHLALYFFKDSKILFTRGISSEMQQQ